MAKITSYKPHTSGVPLGGIGSGCVELWPDGEFHSWQIYDMPRRTSLTPTAPDIQVPLCTPDALAEVSFRSGDRTLRIVQGDLDGWKITNAAGGSMTVL